MSQLSAGIIRYTRQEQGERRPPGCALCANLRRVKLMAPAREIGTTLSGVIAVLDQARSEGLPADSCPNAALGAIVKEAATRERAAINKANR